MEETRAMQAKGKQTADEGSEQTRTGPVFTPEVDIFENDAEIRMQVDMPGVKPEDLSIDLCDDALTIGGEVGWEPPAGESPLVVEFEVGRFFRRFALVDAVDQSRIEARLANGVLDLRLPKHAKASPRRIPVNAS